MSKRDQGAAVSYYIEHGYLPEAVVNYLCLLGWSPKDDRQKMSIAEVVRDFSLKHIVKGEATFDPAKLRWLNGEYARELPFERFYSLGIEALKRKGIPLARFSADYLRAALKTCETKIAVLDELPAYAGFYFTDSLSYPTDAAAKQFTSANKPLLEAVRNALKAMESFDLANVESALRQTASDKDVKLGALIHPTRLAVTGATSGPSLYHLLEVLGREKVLGRLDDALASF
jgi:glutamyl-tRNA synthetase